MLGVSWPIYVAVDSPNIGFPYFLGGVPVKKTTCMFQEESCLLVISQHGRLLLRKYPSPNLLCRQNALSGRQSKVGNKPFWKVKLIWNKWQFLFQLFNEFLKEMFGREGKGMMTTIWGRYLQWPNGICDFLETEFCRRYIFGMIFPDDGSAEPKARRPSIPQILTSRFSLLTKLMAF